MDVLFIDIETYSSVDLGECGAYKYVESPDYEILMVGYAFNDEDVEVVDMACGETLPEGFIKGLTDPNVRKVAHNATFERLGFRWYGYDVPASQWYCTMVKAAYCGLPLSLEKVSEVLDLKEKKLHTGKDCISYFSCPHTPNKRNGFRTRLYPTDNPEKWEVYKEYNRFDVKSEREIYKRLSFIEVPDMERHMYVLDQMINDKGVLLDVELAKSAVYINDVLTERLTRRAVELTGLDNPNSPQQLKAWIKSKTNATIASLSKGDISELASRFKFYPDVTEMLDIRAKLSKTSIAKYTKVLETVCADQRGHGYFQFYGANRTGRWAGRLLQLQNLSKNHDDDIDSPRNLVKSRDLGMLEMLYENIPDILSQLVRTTLIAPQDMIFSVADFSAIEARVISWLAQSKWRLDVFRGNGKIYEANAARMFKVPIESILKGSIERTIGKTSELALGYGGGISALRRMDESMGGKLRDYSDMALREFVMSWRDANPEIVRMWSRIEDAFYKAGVEGREFYACNNRLKFFRLDRLDADGNVVGNYTMIRLPSGRCLCYVDVVADRDGRLSYGGMNQTTKKWDRVDTYGGKLTENIIQAIARDVLVNSLFNMESKGYIPVSHVHDEAICEVPLDRKDECFEEMCALMSIPPYWANDLPLVAAGYTTPYYIKD